MATVTRETFSKWRRWSQTKTLLGAADVDKVVTSVDMKVGSYTIAAQPTVPSRISVTVTAGATADTMGIVTIVGTNDLDQVISEVIIPVAGSTVYGLLYFKTVTSATGSAWVIDGVEGTKDAITIGVSMETEILVRGRDITFIDVSGNIFINPETVATAANGFPLVTGQSYDLNVAEKLSVIADSSGATFKYVIY